jgi:hypothetical protein
MSTIAIPMGNPHTSVLAMVSAFTKTNKKGLVKLWNGCEPSYERSAFWNGSILSASSLDELLRTLFQINATETDQFENADIYPNKKLY